MAKLNRHSDTHSPIPTPPTPTSSQPATRMAIGASCLDRPTNKDSTRNRLSIKRAGPNTQYPKWALSFLPLRVYWGIGWAMGMAMGKTQNTRVQHMLKLVGTYLHCLRVRVCMHMQWGRDGRGSGAMAPSPWCQCHANPYSLLLCILFYIHLFHYRQRHAYCISPLLTEPGLAGHGHTSNRIWLGQSRA